MGTVFYVFSQSFLNKKDAVNFLSCFHLWKSLASGVISSSAFLCLVEIGSQKARMFFFNINYTKPHGILQGLRYVGGAF